MLEAFVVDVNGIARGKWVPADRIPEIMAKGVALPRSVYALDVWGCDVPEAGLAVGTATRTASACRWKTPCCPSPG